MKKKYLMITDHLPNTGLGKYTFNIHESLKENGLNVDMLVQQHKRNGFNPDIIFQKPFLNLPYREYKGTFDFLGYYYFSKKIPKDYSLHHITSQTMGKYCDKAVPSVVTCHDIIGIKFHENNPFFIRYFRKKHLENISKAERIIFVSEYSKKDFLEMYDYPEKKTNVIYNGVNKEIFKPRDKKYAREKLGLSLDRPIILSIGSEDPRKNLDTIFKSIKNLKKNIPDILLVRVGRKGKESLIDKLDLEENVKYFKNNIPEQDLSLYYNAADLFVFPSYYEGFGMPIVEAFSSGLPLVASNASCIPEVTNNSALLSDPSDINGFTNNIEKILTDDKIRQEYISKGLKRA